MGGFIKVNKNVFVMLNDTPLAQVWNIVDW